MAPGNKASVDNSTTIRAASKNKHRSQPANRSAASPFGSSAGGSLASSLSSLFAPQPHGKDAALASLLASSSKPPVKLGEASRLAAFGSFPSSLPASSQSLDDKQKDKRKNAAATSTFSAPAASAAAAAAAAGQANVAVKDSASSSNDAAPKSSAGPKDQQQKQTSSDHRSASSTASSSKPVVPNAPAGRRPVFRPVLASSTAVSWPEMPVAGSKTVLHTLLELLAQPDVQKTLQRDLGRRSRSRSSQAKRKRRVDAMDVDGDAPASSGSAESGPAQVLAGINSITRAIEADISRDLAQLRASSTAAKGKRKAGAVAAPPSVRIVFVCRHDVPQPSLVAHLPMLVTARNAVLHASRDDAAGVLLFALPSGSEALLANALGLKRASILALTSAFSSAQLSHLLAAVQRETGSVCHLRASWLESAMRAHLSHTQTPTTMPLKPTSIKLLRTTQPLDLNACKAAKKTKRKQRSARWKKRKLALQQRVKSLRAQLKLKRPSHRSTTATAPS